MDVDGDEPRGGEDGERTTRESRMRASAHDLLDTLEDAVELDALEDAVAAARQLLVYVDEMVLADPTEEIGARAAAERSELAFRLFDALTDFVERFEGKGKAMGRGKGKAKGTDIDNGKGGQGKGKDQHGKGKGQHGKGKDEGKYGKGNRVALREVMARRFFQGAVGLDEAIANGSVVQWFERGVEYCQIVEFTAAHQPF